MKHSIKSLIITALSLLSGITNASLIDRGNGMIYDDDLNITWLKDANFAKTGNFDTDGRLSWAGGRQCLGRATEFCGFQRLAFAWADEWQRLHQYQLQQ